MSDYLSLVGEYSFTCPMCHKAHKCSVTSTPSGTCNSARSVTFHTGKLSAQFSSDTCAEFIDGFAKVSVANPALASMWLTDKA